jgi:hypothetical protein
MISFSYANMRPIRYRYDPRNYNEMSAFIALVNSDSTMAPDDFVRINDLYYEKAHMLSAYFDMTRTRYN